ncbi:MAG: hypothetical protein ACFFG0_07815 [Candidatus Thorarchaeota archaeon]
MNIKFFITINRKNGNFRLYKSDKFKRSVDEIIIPVIANIPESIINPPEYVLKLETNREGLYSGSIIQSGVDFSKIKQFEDELNRLKNNESD